MAQELVMNDLELKVSTPTGFHTFAGVTKTWHEKVIEIKTASRTIVAGLKHKFLVDEGWVESQRLTPGMSLTTEKLEDDLILEVTTKEDPQWMYDLLDVEGGNAYIANGVMSHNCEFLSSDALLINSLKLHQLKAAKPVMENMGFRFWTDKIGGRGKTYLVGVDPATGSGSDFTAIQVVEFPALEQVAELRLNSVQIPLIYAKIKWLLKFLRQPDQGRGRAEVIWSFERNGVGEALVAMIQNDDAADGGVYLDGVELFNEGQNRLGCYTTGKSKLVSCMQLKGVVEKVGGLKINSDALLFELQNFIAAGGSYQAKSGATDDCVMAMVLVMKLLNRLSAYDDGARKIVYETVQPDADENSDQFDPDDAMPFTFV
jgi:hypothetical protein